MKNKDETSEYNFRIRLEARLKNDALINAREQLGFSQIAISACLGISQPVYGDIERMQRYPDENLQKAIMDFYKDHGIILDQKKVFPEQLKEAKFKGRYIVSKEIPVDRLLPFSTLDRKLLMPVEIEDREIREDDLRKTIERILKSLPQMQSAAQYKDVIQMYFGLSPYDKEHSDEEIAEKYHVSGGRIQQIRQKAIRKLRHHLRSNKLRPFLGEEH